MSVTGDTNPDVKPVVWIGSSLKDLRRFPQEVRLTVGQAIFDAQKGTKHPDAKPLKGFGNAGILEVVADNDGSTYRTVYTVRFSGFVYVLHAFQKKSKKGMVTPAQEIKLIRSRLKDAERHYVEWKKQQG